MFYYIGNKICFEGEDSICQRLKWNTWIFVYCILLSVFHLFIFLNILTSPNKKPFHCMDRSMLRDCSLASMAICKSFVINDHRKWYHWEMQLLIKMHTQKIFQWPADKSWQWKILEYIQQKHVCWEYAPFKDQLCYPHRCYGSWKTDQISGAMIFGAVRVAHNFHCSDIPWKHH